MEFDSVDHWACSFLEHDLKWQQLVWKKSEDIKTVENSRWPSTSPRLLSSNSKTMCPSTELTLTHPTSRRYSEGRSATWSVPRPWDLGGTGGQEWGVPTGDYKPGREPHQSPFTPRSSGRVKLETTSQPNEQPTSGPRSCSDYTRVPS